MRTVPKTATTVAITSTTATPMRVGSNGDACGRATGELKNHGADEATFAHHTRTPAVTTPQAAGLHLQSSAA
jgi:hypothetical protein